MSRNRNLSKALKTDISGLLPMVADALKKHGRGKDTMLAHITPGEARLLKAHGGSGTINPKTGLPEFDPDPDFIIPGISSADYFQSEADRGALAPTNFETVYTESPAPQQQVTTTPDSQLAGSRYDAGSISGLPSYGFLGAQPYVSSPYTGTQDYPIATNEAQTRAMEIGLGMVPPAGQAYGAPATTTAPVTGADVQAAAGASDQGNLGTPQQQQQQQQAAKQGFLDKAGDQLLKGISDPATLAKLGLGLGSGALGYSMQQKAIAQAKNAAAQIKQAQQTAAAQERALAQPIANQAASVMSQTVQGQLTPASLQAFQAMQAQEAQRMASAGGVGAQQMEANHARAIQTLLDGQQKTYLSLFAASNPMMTDAINKDLAGTTQGLTTSLDLQAKANQASAQLYSSIMSALAGSMKSGQ